MVKLVSLAEYRHPVAPIFFARHELKRLLAVYSARVAEGAWRDYAIDHRPDMAAFAVFRHSFDGPQFVITKSAQGRRSRRAFAVFAGCRKLIEGDSLDQVLKVFDSPLKVVS